MVCVLSACANWSMQADNHVSHCSSLASDAKIIQCYNKATSILIARRILLLTHGFSDGDWPHAFQMLIQLQVENTGHFQVKSVLRSTGSHLLDKKILQALADIEKLFVPQNELFRTANYAQLKLLVKPARTPLLGEEELMDKSALVVYVTQVLLR